MLRTPSRFLRDTKELQLLSQQATGEGLDPSERGERLDNLIEVAKRLRWQCVEVTPGLEPGLGRPPAVKRNRGMKLFSLYIPEQSTSALVEAGITAREQLLRLSVEELHEIPNLGQAGVNAIRRSLAEAGVRLAIKRRRAA